MTNVIQIENTVFDFETSSKTNHVMAKPITVQDELYFLIQDCIAKSPSAQKKLYEKFSPVAFGIIKRYLYKKDEEAALEILNDAFMKIFYKLNQYSFQGAFEGWVRRIVVHTVADHLRKKIKGNAPHVEIKPETVFVAEDGLDKISYKELLECIQSLPDTARIVFNLYVFENYAHKEIGELLNINENTSRWHLNDARKRLKEKVLKLKRN